MKALTEAEINAILVPEIEQKVLPLVIYTYNIPAACCFSKNTCWQFEYNLVQ
jgi:hypothetical protein